MSKKKTAQPNPWKATDKTLRWQYTQQDCNHFDTPYDLEDVARIVQATPAQVKRWKAQREKKYVKPSGELTSAGKRAERVGYDYGPKKVSMTSKQLQAYDYIVCSSSSGKDSLACLAYVVNVCKKAKVLDRLIVLHCDLGRVEWPGVVQLAKEQANHFGVQFDVRSRIGEPASGDFKPPNKRAWYKRGEKWQDLLSTIGRRYLQLKAVNKHKSTSPWPNDANRYCTGEYKGQVAKNYFMELSYWHGHHTGDFRPINILDCWGIRAEESTARAQRDGFDPERFVPTKRTLSKREALGIEDLWLCNVDTWFPVFCDDRKSIDQIIAKSGAPTHWAYDVGMQRLSCCFCFYANNQAWQIAAYYNPELAKQYIAMEKRVGWPTKANMSVADAVRDLNRTGVPPNVAPWYKGNCPCHQA